MGHEVYMIIETEFIDKSRTAVFRIDGHKKRRIGKITETPYGMYNAYAGSHVMSQSFTSMELALDYIKSKNKN